MKKKIATLLMFLFSCLSIFTGCNLFDTNNYAGLNSVVATSGEIEITREQLINAYNSSGYYYNNYYGQTMEEALKSTINDLIDRQYMLNYVEKLEKTDNRYALTDAEKYDVIKETWDYIDSSIESIVKEVRKDLKLSSEDLSTETEEESSSNSESEETSFKAKEVYKSKFTKDSKGRIVKIEEEENNYIPTNKTKYDYELKLSSTNKDYETIVWNRYITSLKKNQAPYNYNDTSDKAVFNREIDRAYKTNLENAKLEKFENIYKNNFGLDYYEDGEGKFVYYINDVTLQKVAEKYTSIYSSNRELYNMTYSKNNVANLESDLNSFYKTLTNTSSRENYFYYGEPADDEQLLTCLHILVKFTKEQENLISEHEKDPLLQNYLEEILADDKSQANTLAYARSYNEDGEETISTTGTSVEQVFAELTSRIQQEVTVGASNADYINQVTKIFDEFIYKYNQDSGIMNAKFDYVVGTETSAMVNSFTEVVRKLYNNGVADYNEKSVKADYNEDVTLYFPNGVGYAGAISAPFLEEASNYKGYHIVLYTGKLENVVAEGLNATNVYAKLGNVKTSVAYGQSIFEFVFDKLTKDSYSQHQADILATNEKDTVYNTANFSDLY